MFRQIGTTEILLILAVVVFLFGATKLPELSRSVAKSLKIFREEVKEVGPGDSAKDSTTTSSTDAAAQREDTHRPVGEVTSDTTDEVTRPSDR